MEDKREDKLITLQRQLQEERKARRKAEALYRKSQQFISNITNTAPSIIYIFDLNRYLFTYVNDRIWAVLGYQPEEIQAMGPEVLNHLVHPEDLPAFLDHRKQILQKPEEREQSLELRLRHRDGQWKWVYASETVFGRKADGTVETFIGSAIDITEKKLIANQLSEQQKLLRLVIDTNPNFILLKDSQGRIVLTNEAFATLHETSPERMTSAELSYANFYLPPELPQYLEAEERVKRTRQEEMTEETFTTSRGEKIWLLSIRRPLFMGAGEIFILSIFVNITATKLADEQIRRSEREYRQLITHSQGLLFTHDLAGHIISTNDLLQESLGYAADELIGQPITQFIPNLQEDFYREYLGNILTTKKAKGLTNFQHKAGHKKYLTYHNILVEEPGTDPYIIGFAQDITQQVRDEKELKRSKEAAERSAKAKEMFLANMSHEIRTPMNGVLGLIGLLNKTKLDPGQKNYLDLITDSARNLLVIINDILDIAKIEAGKMALETIPFHLNDTLRSAYQSFTYKAEEKDVLLSLDLPELNQPFVSGDPYRLNQILLNLLSNAIKFTDRGKVTLAMKVLNETPDDYQVEICVQDTGPGIAPEKLDMIFEGYTQAHTNTARQFGGTGLGLAISRNLVQMLGGRLWVESIMDEGSRFAFTITYPKSTYQEKPAPAAGSPDFNSLGPIRVLLAEDNLINQFLAKSMLENWGSSVEVAANGQEALALVEQKPFDVILMDIQMPGMDGVEATKRIRKSPNQLKARVPIIALTANALKGDSDLYLAAGMDDYLSKPYEEEKLFLKIAGVLNRPYRVREEPHRGVPVTESEGKPLYNLDHIQSLSRGSSEFIQKMLLLFLQNIPRQLQELRSGLGDSNWQKVSETAHNLKASIDVMLIASIQEEIRYVEINARNRTHLNQVPLVTEKVIRTLEKVMDQIRQNLPAPPVES